MDPTTQDLTRPAADDAVDENLKLQQQQKAATAVPSGMEPGAIPAPPPLPSSTLTPPPKASDASAGSAPSPFALGATPAALPTDSNPSAPSTPAPPPLPTAGYHGEGPMTDDQLRQSPLYGLDDQAKKLYWAGQGATALSGVGYNAPAITQAGVTGGSQKGYDPAANAAAVAKFRADNGAAIADVTKRVTSRQSEIQGGAPSPAGTTPMPNANLTGAGGSGGATANVMPIDAGPQLMFPGGSPPVPDTNSSATPPLSSRTPLAAPTGSATDVGTPSSAIGSKIGPAVPLGATTGAPFTDANVQIGSTILPNADPRLSGTQSMVDAAAKNLAAVDRTKLAQDMFDQFAASTDPAYKLNIRRATQAAAGAGRIGSGMLRTSYGDLAGDRARELDLQKRGFMSDALNGSIADSFNKFGALAGLEGQQFGQGQATRGELRNERGYQGSLEQQAFERALGQYEKEQGDVKDRFARGITSMGVGESGNPADFYTRMAAQLGVDPSVIMALAGSLGKSSVGQSGGFSIPKLPSFPGGTPPIVAPAPTSTLPPGQYPG